MNGSPTFPKLTERSAEEHGVIAFHLDQLGRALGEFDAGAASADALLDLALRIDSFKDRLEEHFRDEEDGGLLQAVVEALPQTESDLRRLKTEHKRLCGALDELRRVARSGEVAQAAAIKVELERVVEAIREHEREEDTLFRRAIRQA